MDIAGPLRILVTPGQRALEIARPGDAAPVFAIDSDGLRSGGQGAVAPAATNDTAFRAPTSGFFTAPIEVLGGGTVPMTSQLLQLSLFQSPVTGPISRVDVAVSTAAGATPSLIRFGLYTVAGTTATLAASTPNDTALLTPINTLSGKALSVPLNVVRGQSLYLAALVVTAAAAPVLSARFGAGAPCINAIQDALFGSGVRQAGTIAAQANLPASFTTTDIVAAVAANALWGWLT
jgi:hypothetical protein